MTYFDFKIDPQDQAVSDAILKLRDTLQNRYYELKEQEGLSQEILAQNMGLKGKGRVSKILNVETNLTLDSLIRIAHHLKMRFRWDHPEYYESTSSNFVCAHATTQTTSNNAVDGFGGAVKIERLKVPHL